MKTPTLPKIDGAELQRLHRSGTIRNAEVIARNVARAANGLPAEAIVALAVAHYPGDAPAAAVVRFGADVDNLVRALEASGKELRADLNAERNRMAPIVAAAAHRGLEIGGEISAIDSRIASIRSGDADKRERLRKAGLIGAELESASAPTDTSALSDKRARLVAESETLERFLQSRDTTNLPAGFAEKVREAA